MSRRVVLLELVDVTIDDRTRTPEPQQSTATQARLVTASRTPGHEIVLVPRIRIQRDVDRDSVLEIRTRVVTVAVPVIAHPVSIAVDVDVEAHTQQSAVISFLTPAHFVVAGRARRSTPRVPEARHGKDRLDRERELRVIRRVVDVDHENTDRLLITVIFLLFPAVFPVFFFLDVSFRRFVFVLGGLIVVFHLFLFLRGLLVVVAVVTVTVVAVRLATDSRTSRDVHPSATGRDGRDVHTHLVHGTASDQMELTDDPIFHRQDRTMEVAHQQVHVPGRDRKRIPP